MTQFAIVKRLSAPDKAEVEVMRGTACGDECGSCQVCKYTSQILVSAENPIAAQVGDRVEKETASSRILGAAALVYLVPFALFFIGYAISAYLGMTQTGSVVMSFAFFAAGMLMAVLVGRRGAKKPITYEITRILDGGECV